MNTIFRSNFINPLSQESVDVISSGYLEVNYTGNIVALQKGEPNSHAGSSFVDLENRVIMPGFIDTHIHLPQYQFLGQGLGIELLPWLEQFTFPAEAKFSDPDLAEVVAKKFFDDLLSHGTTTASIYATVHEEATNRAFKVAYEKGIRAFIGKVMMDRNSPPDLIETTKESIDSSVRLFSKWDGVDRGRLRYIFTPRFAPTCSDELLEQVGIFVSQGAYAQTHLSENLGEIEWVRGLYPANKYESSRSRSYTHAYGSFGLLGEKVVMAHCIHNTDEETSLLAQTLTKIAHCPYSNENLRSGVMPYFKWKQRGLTIGLGTDVAGGPSISMPRQMGKAIEAAQILDNGDMSPIEAFYLATLGGANVLGISHITGSLQVGKDADFVVIDPKELGLSASNALGVNLLESLCRSTGNNFIDQTYVRGKQVYQKNKT